MNIAIVGGAPSGMQAPFSDENWEIWVHGNQFDRFHEQRVTRIFEIHENLSEHEEGYPAWLVEQGIRMTVSDEFPIQAPHVIPFPYEADVLNMLSSTPVYMMALAIYEGATHIGIYGVDMSVGDHEYFKQRPAMYAWIGYAKGLGIEITIPDDSPLFKDDYDEGRDWSNPAKTPFSEESFLQIAKIHQEKMDVLMRDFHTHDGCRQAYERMARVARAGNQKNLTDSLEIR